MKKIRILAVGMVCVMMVLYFSYITIRDQKHVTVKPDVNALIQRDLKKDYPKKPEEVVNFYGEIVMVLLNEDVTTDQMNHLISKSRKLMDQELLESYSQAQYQKAIVTTQQKYQKKNMRMEVQEIDVKNNVVYEQKNKVQYCVVKQIYYTHRKSIYTKHQSKFMLRENKDGLWKIYSMNML